MNGRKLIPGKPVPASEVPDYTIRRDTLDEVLSDLFRQRLQRLNGIVQRSGERLEGNVFYADGDKGFDRAAPGGRSGAARRNLWRAARFKERMLEVGVNAGHSALLALSSNPRLQYYGVDIMSHALHDRMRRLPQGRVSGPGASLPRRFARSPALAGRSRRGAGFRPACMSTAATRARSASPT